MTLTKTFPTDRPAGLPVADTRLINAGLVECNAAGVPRVGILPAHYNALVTGTAGMAYSVAAFNAVTSRSGNGVEFVANDGAVSVATTAAPGANSRIDVIWVRSLFTTYADGSSDPVFGVTQGTAAASPTKPAIPAGALELATATILSTTTQTSTAVITQTHTYTAMEGGAVAIRNSAELDAWAPADGGLAWLIDAGVLLVRKGGKWTLVAPINARNTYAGVGGVGNGTALVTIPFPALPFDTIVDLDALAQVGNTSGVAGTYIPSFTTVGGMISELAMALYNVASGQWVNVSKDARLTLPAGTAATVTVAASSTQNGQWNVSLRSSRRSA